MRVSGLELAGRAKRVGIGQAMVGSDSDALRVTLGSCVGLCLIQPRRSIFGAAHILLPTRSGTATGPDSRFADTAVGYLMKLMEIPKRTRDMVAFIAGGAALFSSQKQRTNVGATNAETLEQSLDAHRIRIVGRDLGGAHSRQLLVNGPSLQVVSILMEDEVRETEWPFPADYGLERL